MELKDTIDLMLSSDYKDRFKGEYHQLKTRINGLNSMLEKMKAGTLEFTPICTYELLTTQLSAMFIYAMVLEDRAKEEDIDLEN